jgi:glycosyltransferase involved in cell wall biosynthesis
VHKRKILFIVPALRRAGAESQLMALVNGLPGSQFEKHLLTYRPGDDLRSELNTSEVRLHELVGKRKLELTIGKNIARIIDDCEIDIVHCTLQNALLYGMMGAFFAKRRPAIVSVIHTTSNVDAKHELADWLVYRPLLKRCSQIWFVSDNQARRWIKKMPFIADHYHVIHNGVDIDEFRPGPFVTAGQELRASLNISGDANVICSVAGFRPEKLHTVLIDAVRIVLSKGVSCYLLLAGEGALKNTLQKKVSDLDLENNVLFLGALPDVRNLLAASNCKALVSAAETLSMAMLEAMAMQVPVITTEVGGASEVIEDGISGYLIPPGDAIILAEKIIEILNGDERRLKLGVCARESVVKRFSELGMLDASANKLLELSVS